MSKFEDYIQNIVWILGSYEYRSQNERAEDLARLLEGVSGDIRRGLILFILSCNVDDLMLGSDSFKRGPYVVAGNGPLSLEISCAAKNFLGNIYSALSKGSLEDAAEIIDLYTDKGVCLECRVAIFSSVITSVRTYIAIHRKKSSKESFAG